MTHTMFRSALIALLALVGPCGLAQVVTSGAGQPAQAGRCVGEFAQLVYTPIEFG